MRGSITIVPSSRSAASPISLKSQAYAALNRLERTQKERRELENDGETCNGETWAEHCVIGLIKDAFAEQPDPDIELLNELEPLDDVDPDTLTPEQQKAVIHRQRAALIRRLKHALKDPSFDRTVAEIVAGPSLDAKLYRQSAGPHRDRHIAMVPLCPPPLAGHRGHTLRERIWLVRGVVLHEGHEEHTKGHEGIFLASDS
jgi:hypothetical protein